VPVNESATPLSNTQAIYLYLAGTERSNGSRGARSSIPQNSASSVQALAGHSLNRRPVFTPPLRTRRAIDSAGTVIYSPSRVARRGAARSLLLQLE